MVDVNMPWKRDGWDFHERQDDGELEGRQRFVSGFGWSIFDMRESAKNPEILREKKKKLKHVDWQYPVWQEWCVSKRLRISEIIG